MVRASVALYVACMVGLLTGYMVIAGMEVPAAGWVQGGPEVAPGPNALRVRLDRVKDGRALLPAAPMTLTVGQTPATLSSPKAGVWPGVVELPDAPDGAVKVAFDALIDDEEHVRGAGEVRLRRAPGLRPLTSRRQQEIQPGTIGVSGESGEVKIVFLPAHGELVRGIPQRVYARTTDTYGSPLACDITIIKRDGVLDGPDPTGWRTDEMGLGWLEVSPLMDMRMELSARCGTLTGEATWYLTSVPAQMTLSMASHAVKPGTSATGKLKTLATSGTLWVEVVEGGAWRWSGASGMGDGESAFSALIPPSAKEGLLQIQASQDMNDAGSAWEARYVVVTPEGDVRAAASWMGRLLVSRDETRWRAWVGAMEARLPLASEQDVSLWLELMLSEIPPSFAPPTLWLHTIHEDQAKLDAWRAEARWWLFGAIALGMLVGLIGLTGAVGRMAALRAARLRAFEASELEEEAQGQLARGGDAMSVRVQAALVIGTLMLFGLCLLMVLRLL